MKPNKTIRVKSSDGKKTYTVQHFDTYSTCTCEGFKHRHVCRHITGAAPKQRRHVEEEPNSDSPVNFNF